MPKRRWWDGEAWTQHVAAVGQSATARDREHHGGQSYAISSAVGSGILAAAALGPRMPGANADYVRQSRRDAMARTAGPGRGASGASPAEVEHAYIPMAMNTPVQFRRPQGPTTSFTLAAWMIAFLPAIELAAVLMLIFGLSNFGRFMQAGVALIFFLWAAGLASRDKQRLITAGHIETASPWWLLLSPLAYLIARTVYVHQQTGRGSSPLWAYLVLSIVPTFAAIVFLMKADVMHLVAVAAAQ